MQNIRKFAVFVTLVCAFAVSFCSATENAELNAADLVRAVRKSEMWMYNFESLYFRAKGKWTTTPEGITKRRLEIKETFNIDDPNEKRFPGLRKTSEDILEYAVDRKRVRYLTDDPGYRRCLKIWDGNELRIHEKYYNHPQNCYIIYNKIQERTFHELFACWYGWPRSQAHSFWWNPRDVTRSIDLYGRPEDFKLVGKKVYRKIPCYVLDHDYVKKGESTGIVYRWFVSQHKPLLYGVQRLYHNQIAGEHWTLDYREVVPGGWFPMQTGWSQYDWNEAGRTYLGSTKNFEVVDFRLNKSLPDDLFQLTIEPGVEVQDHRSSEFRSYIMWPSLLGKILPSFEEFNLPGSVPAKCVPFLLCFMDLEQRPSRHAIRELTAQSKMLKSNSVELLLIQSSSMSSDVLNQWREEMNISFEIATMTGDVQAIRWSLGVQALPWLILTDKKHIVQAEGFGINELDEKITTLRKK